MTPFFLLSVHSGTGFFGQLHGVRLLYVRCPLFRLPFARYTLVFVIIISVLRRTEGQVIPRAPGNIAKPGPGLFENTVIKRFAHWLGPTPKAQEPALANI